MKKFVFYWHKPDGEWNMEYWSAPNFSTAKKQIKKAYLVERLKKGMVIDFIAEIKYEEWEEEE